MVKQIKPVIGKKERQLWLDNAKKTLVYQKGSGIFAFNFHPVCSYAAFFAPVPEAGRYQVLLSTDDGCFGGQMRIGHQCYDTVEQNGKTGILLYLPSRTALILKKKG